jgi:predicted GTPase
VTVFDYREVDGRRMVLIDTPGFDDSRDDMTDADILQMISAFLKEE